MSHERHSNGTSLILTKHRVSIDWNHQRRRVNYCSKIASRLKIITFIGACSHFQHIVVKNRNKNGQRSTNMLGSNSIFVFLHSTIHSFSELNNNSTGWLLNYCVVSWLALAAGLIVLHLLFFTTEATDSATLIILNESWLRDLSLGDVMFIIYSFTRLTFTQAGIALVQVSWWDFSDWFESYQVWMNGTLCFKSCNGINSLNFSILVMVTFD